MPVHSDRSPSPVAGRVAELLELDGLHAALRHLNARTRHRFTAVYVFDPPMLRGCCLVDRENASVRFAGDTRMDETYCSLVADDERPFATDDSLRDARLAGHPGRERVQAYGGVPLCDESGACFASLCHWDVRPRILAQEELALLREVAPAVARATLAAFARR